MVVKARRALVFLMAFVMIATSLTILKAPNAYAEGGAVDTVKAAIDGLSNDPRNFTAADIERVEAIWADYEALSAEDKAAIDSTSGHPSGDTQYYGRILEAAVWAVRSFGTDAGTTLANGTYTTATDPAVSSESNKGKSDSTRTRNWWVESVVVENGQATAYIYVTEGAATARKLTSYPSIWYAGNTIARNADNNYPIPVDLNGITYFGGISSSMPRPIMYALSTTINETVSAADYTAVDAALAKVPENLNIYTDESAAAVTTAVAAVERGLPASQQAKVDAMAAAIEAAVKGLVEKETGAIEFAITNKNTMFKVAKAVLEGTTLKVTMNSGSYDYLFAGHSEEAEDAADSDMIPIDPDTHVFVMEVEDLDEPLLLAFHSVKNSTFYDRTFTFDLKAKTLVTDDYTEPVEEIDDLTTEEAIAKADKLASVEMVNSLIRAIKVQSRDENTDKYCAVAKAYYDALSDEDKDELIDPDYFRRDTGDASKDDPRNQDEIGEKEILVTSFGTSFNDSRAETIKAVEDALANAYPDWSVRRAFTAQIIINHIQSRDGEVIDNMEQALERAVKNGVKELVVQPTHLMHGAEYDEMCDILAEYEDKIDTIIISEPLLNSDEDKRAVAMAAVAEAVADGDFESLEAMKAAKTALVFMGHGTSHEANVTYTEMQETMKDLGYDNVFVGTVEGEPEGTDADSMVEKVKAAGYTSVILRPLMVVAGDHANNDMADMEDEGSWASIFSKELGEDNVTCQINGLGEIEDVQQIYVSHVKDALPVKIDLDITNNSGMFKAVTAHLEKAGGKTTLVMALSGTGYKNLFKGTYEQAVANGDHTENWIAGYTNKDGKLEFRIPVADGETYLPLVAVSQSYYDKYKAGENSLDRAFYPRQAEVNEKAKTLVTGDYEFSQEIAVTNNVKMLKVNEKATLDTVGGPNSNNYKADLVLTMGSDSYNAAYVGSFAEASKAEETIALGDSNIFRIPVKWVETFGQPETLKNLANGEPFYLSLKSKSKGTWYERIATLDEAAGTLVLDPSDADYAAVDAAKEKVPADLSIYTDETAKAVTDAVAAVETGKFKSQQAEVDAMAKAIEDAIAKLEYRSYKITWLDEDGKTVLATDEVKYGDMPVYKGKTPEKPADEAKKVFYTFEKWSPDVAAVTGEASYKAVYKENAITYVFETAGSESMTWTMGSNADFNFTVHRTYLDGKTIDHFESIEIDGKKLENEKDYSVASGSLKGTIKAAYMKTLSEGKHTLKVNFDDGSAETTITVAKQAPADKSSDGAKNADPAGKTGDENNMTLWIILLAAALIGGTASVVAVKRKKESK